MSDFESFSSSESVNQGSTAESFRLFQERMKVAAAQIKAIRAGEQRQKKKEDELAKILSEFIKSHQHDASFTEFIVLISKLLALNLPAVFILSFLILNFPDLQTQSGLKMLSLPEALQANALDAQTLPDLYWKNHTLPPHLKIQIDNWIQAISMAAIDSREKLLKNGVTATDQFRPEIVEMMTFSLSTYLQKIGFAMAYEPLRKFTDFCLQGILQEIQKGLPELGNPL